MRSPWFLVALGISLGGAGAAGQAARADAIDDAWPYPVIGFGMPTDQHLTPYLFGLGQQGINDYDDFSTHAYYFSVPVVPFVISYVHGREEVFDSTVALPPDGTIYDRTTLVGPAGLGPIVVDYMVDPYAGFEARFVFGAFVNDLVVNDVGVKDEILFLTSTYTLFEFEWPGAVAADALADLF